MKEIPERAGYVVLATGSFGAAIDRLAQFEIDLPITHPCIETIPGHEAARSGKVRNISCALYCRSTDRES